MAPIFTVGSPKIPTLGAQLAPRILRYKYDDIVASQRHKTYAISYFMRHYRYRPILLHFSTLANTNEHLEVPSDVIQTHVVQDHAISQKTPF